MNRITVIILGICSLALSQTTDLFFSEYAEGSEGNNKYIEIYNGTGVDVDLSNYQVWGSNDGGGWKPERQHSLSGTLVDGDVYVIAADAASQAILDETDLALAYESAVHFNGDDAVGLAKNDGTRTFLLIDVIGEPDNDPGSGWDVAGVTAATKDHTLVRKASVTSGNTTWTSSAGTSVDNSEWLVDIPPTNTYTPETLGSHPHVDPAIAITSPADGATFYTPDVTVSFDVSNFTVATAGNGDGHIHYALDGGSTVMQYTTNDIALTGLTETSHSFIIWLVDDNHANLTPHVADTVTFTVSQPPVTTPISNIQYTTSVGSGDDCYPSSEDGNNVQVGGTVTAVTSSGHFYIQDGPDVWDGIFVYDTSIMPAEGDEITMTAEVGEYYGLTELKNISSSTVLSTGNDLYDPIVITTGDLSGGCEAIGESYEGLLVKINNVVVTAEVDQHGQWFVDDGTGACEVEDSFFDYEPSVGDVILSITGVVSYGYGEYELNPRGINDIDLGGPPVITNVSLNPTSPTEVDIVTVSATITDDGTIASATLTYNAGTTDTDVTMTNTTGDTYTGTIPAQAGGTTVTFSITAVDNEGNSATSDESSYLVISTGGTITSIYNIQHTTDTSGDSPLVGQTVTISGVITAEFWGSSYNSVFFVQDSLGPWSGIMVYTNASWDEFDIITSSGIVHSLAEGDSVTVTGAVYEHLNKTEITDVSEVIVHGPATNVYEPITVTISQVMTGGTEAEAYEGCLVKVANVSVDNSDLGNGEWSITDGTNSMRVDDLWDYYFFPDSGHALTEVVGLLDYTYSNFKLQPRLARDIVEEGVTRIQRINQVLYSDLLKVAEDDTSDYSYYFNGDTFTVEGIVTVATGLAYAGSGVKLIFKDYNGGPWSGLICYSADPSALGSQPIGRKIRATGVISEYGSDTYDGNVTEIDIVQPIQVLGFDPTAVPIDSIHTGDLRYPQEAEQWGAVWVEINNAYVIRNDLNWGQWTIDDGTGEIKIGTNSSAVEWDDISIWSRPPVGSFVESIRGWVYNRHGFYSDSTAFKLEPNYPSDITFGAGPPIISLVHRDPCVVTPTDQVTVSADITDNSFISQAFVHYRIAGAAWDSVSMSMGANDIWSGDIPSTGTDDVFVEYYISGYDDGVEQDGLIKLSFFPNIENGNYMGYISKTGDLTIHDIQFSPWPSGVSPYINCGVTVTGIVTADSVDYQSGSYNAYAMQSESTQWSGLFFNGDNLPGFARGDEITITGKVIEYYGSTKIDTVTAVSILSSNNVVSPLMVSTADLAENADEVEAYEGCLVTVSDVTVSSLNQYDWSIKDYSNISCLVDDDMATMAADNYMSGFEVGTPLETVSGIFNFSFGEYKIEVRDMMDLGLLSVDDNFDGIIKEYTLYPNFPNPFNPETSIHFQLAKHSDVKLTIYDVLGRKVRTLVSNKLDAGNHVVIWDGLNDEGTNVASGMYVYRIKAGDFIAHRKMLLVR